jgi:hypothetical protein
MRLVRAVRSIAPSGHWYSGILALRIAISESGFGENTSRFPEIDTSNI